MLEGIDGGFWYWDLVTRKLESSGQIAALLGYTADELGHSVENWLELVHPDDIPTLPRPEDLLASVDRGDTTQLRWEYRMMTKSGDWRWIFTQGKVVAHSPQGKPTRLAGTSVDVTERKRTEAALRESQQKLKRSAHLLEQTQAAAHVGGWEIDLRTDRLFWTDETYRIHEVNPGEFAPTVENAIEFYALEDRPKIRHAVEQTIRNGTSYDLEIGVITAKQRRIQVNTVGHAEFEQGRVVKVYGSVRDVTEQRKAAQDRDDLQRKMLEAQKLESLGVLAGGIAHDFNNLLTVVLANASFLRLGSGELAARDERLGLIENAARRAADMCSQMLAYAGRGTFVLEKVNLSTLVQDTARLLLVSITKKARSSWPWIRACPRLMPIPRRSARC